MRIYERAARRWLAFLNMRFPDVQRPSELRRDPHSSAGLHHRAFKDGIYVQLAGNLGQRFTCSTLVTHGGCPRNYPQGADAGDFTDQFVGHPVGEVVLGGVARQILQRQHRNRLYPFRG